MAEACPDTDAEWLFYQALAGAWPADLSLEDEEGLQALAERLAAFMIKALREAKRRTSWTDRDEPYETAVENYVRSLFAPEHRELLRGIRATIAAIEPAGIVNSLAQLTLKLTLPGIPDIYQGCELLDFSMVDPDNRRPVDFDLRRRLLADIRRAAAAETMQRWREGLPKLWLLDRLLHLRCNHADLFDHGHYEPLEVVGDRTSHVVAYSRTLGNRRILVAVPRLVLWLCEPEHPSWLGDAFIRTKLHLPGRFRTLTGEIVGAGEAALADLWRDFPIAVLEPE